VLKENEQNYLINKYLNDIEEQAKNNNADDRLLMKY
jgi:hypothetical protein